MRDVLTVLRRPRFLGLAALTVVLALLFVYMSSWQQQRADQEGAKADLFEQNVTAEPLVIDEAFAPGEPLPADMDWRAGSATGTYEPSAQVLVRNRAQDGQNGLIVAVPLLTTEGTWLWVARGWVPAGATAAALVETATPPQGVVTVSGVVRPSETPDGDIRPPDVPEGHVTALDVTALAPDLPGPSYGFVLQADLEDPAPVEPLVPIKPPTGVGGNLQNLSYALQWGAFAVIAVIGFAMVVRIEVREMREKQAPADESPEDSSTADAGPPQRS